MSDIFISYQRENQFFVQHLAACLEKCEKVVWYDAQLTKGDKWMPEILRAIEVASTFVFAISPTSLKSEICHQELAHALGYNKKIVPIVYIPVNVKSVEQELMALPASLEVVALRNWNEIKNINWIYFREQVDDFEQSLQQLIKAADTDLKFEKKRAELEFGWYTGICG